MKQLLFFGFIVSALAAGFTDLNAATAYGEGSSEPTKAQCPPGEGWCTW